MGKIPIIKFLLIFLFWISEAAICTIIIIGIEISINNCGPDPNQKYHFGRITNKVNRNMVDTFSTMLNKMNFFIEFIVCWIANPLYLVVVFHFWFIEFFCHEFSNCFE